MVSRTRGSSENEGTPAEDDDPSEAASPAASTAPVDEVAQPLDEQAADTSLAIASDLLPRTEAAGYWKLSVTLVASPSLTCYSMTRPRKHVPNTPKSL